MRLTRLLVTAVALALAGAVALHIGTTERELAAAQEHVLTRRYDDAGRALARARHAAGLLRWIPRAGAAVDQELATREAAVRYWARDYAGVLPREADPVGAVDAANVDLQLIVANAAFRAGQMTPFARPAAAVQALDEAIGGYLVVLKHERWHPDAAFNYEYLVRVRDEVARGRRALNAPPPDDDDLGDQGAPAPVRDAAPFEIYIPLDDAERSDSGEAGKMETIQRKG